MAKVYLNLIKHNRLTINDVPTRWRAKVQELIDNDPEMKNRTAQEG